MPGRHRLDAAATKRVARTRPETPEASALAPAGSTPAAVEVPPAGEIAAAWHDLMDAPLPSAGSPPPAVEVPPAGEIAPAWHDLVDAPNNLPAVPDLTWGHSPWGTPVPFDPDDVWDSTEEHAFSDGPIGDAIRIPRQANPGGNEDHEPLKMGAAPGIFAAPASLDKTALADQVASLEDRYLTPAGPLTPGLAPVRRLRRTAKVARYAALGFIALLGIAAVVGQPHVPVADDLSNSSQSMAGDRAAAAAADRSQERGAAPSATAQASAAATPSASPSKSPAPKPKPAVAALPVVAGFDKAQMTNARTIVQTGQKLRVPSRGLLIALMTAMQESDLYNQASSAVPESFNYPHQGDSVDYDSCGLFQQRTSMGWGTVKQIMDPVYSSTMFYQKLLQVAGWQNMDLTLAAQAVQGSAFPYAYAQHEAHARTILSALT
jgi:hypothetical protein